MAHLDKSYTSYETFLRGADAIWSVDLRQLNNSQVSGSALVALDTESDGTRYLNVSIFADSMTPREAHPQHIHGTFDADGNPTNAVTPDLADDADGDGFVEVLEGVGDYGDVILTLIENGGAPVANAAGDIAYIQSFDIDIPANLLSPVTGTQYDADDLMPLTFREIVLHGETVAAGPGAGTGGEINGMQDGYVPILPVAAGEIEATDLGTALAALAAQRAAASDTLRLGDDDDYVNAGVGDDMVWGGGGNDHIAGGTDDDVLRGDGGNDFLYGGAGDDQLLGGNGNDILRASEGKDRASGGNGDDRIWGGNGSDMIWGGNGDDRIWGGSGDDQIRGGNGDDAIWSGNGDGWSWGGNGDDLMWGANGADLMLGGNGDDLMVGGNGNDRVWGGNDDDHIWGGSGEDVMEGGNGDDVIGGGRGDDMLRGGTGDDVFVFDAMGGDDVVADYDANHDTLWFTGGVGDRGIVQDGADAVITYTDGSVTLIGVDIDDVMWMG